MLKLFYRTSLLKTIYYSMRFKLLIIVGRNTKLIVSRRAKIIGTKGAILFVGLDYFSCKTTILHIDNCGSLYIKGNASFKKGTHISIQKDASLTIGNKTFINEDTKILVYKQISIGDFSAISYDVLITDSDVHSYSGKESTKAVFIGSNVWVGARSIILKGVHIADNCVVSAGSKVRNSFPSSVLIAEEPAVIRKKNIFWER